MTTQGAREEILARIRSALTDRPVPQPVVRDYRTAETAFATATATAPDRNDVPRPGPGTEAPAPPHDALLLDRLTDRLTDYRAIVHRTNPTAAPGVIAEVLTRHRLGRVVVPAGFPPDLLADIPPAAVVRDEPALTATELDLVDGVLTTSSVAIADTGTIVLDCAPGQGRRVLSLVPDHHLCVVRAEDVVAGVPEGVARLRPVHPGANRPQTWISGPSATSDIELQRVEGVHGPRTLVVVLVST